MKLLAKLCLVVSLAFVSLTSFAFKTCDPNASDLCSCFMGNYVQHCIKSSGNPAYCNNVPVSNVKSQITGAGGASAACHLQHDYPDPDECTVVTQAFLNKCS